MHEASEQTERELLAQVHPADWVNPQPAPRYDLVVLGAGTAGLVSAAGAAGLGARVALVEARKLGGDCLNAGCVPSKGLIRAARAAHDARTASVFGVQTGPVTVDFAVAAGRMRALRAGIARNDSAARFRGLGVDVFLGEGRFTGPDTLEVDGSRLSFRRAIVATGSRPVALPTPGLDAAGFLTNETVFELEALPRRLAVIGAGPIGCELAQAFRRFGSEVTVIAKEPHLLPREDADASAILAAQFAREGVAVRLDAALSRVEQGPAGKTLHLADGPPVVVDEILVAVGRRPTLEGLGLDAAGVETVREGVRVDDGLRTTNPRIYAAGDVCSRFKFTHAADALARIALQNALFPGRKKASALVIPWCTYTDPEIAHVGLSASDGEKRGATSTVIALRDVDRAVLDGETDGFARVLSDPKGRILGATLVARHAGELIAEVTLAMTAGLGLGTLGATIHPYPTQSEVWKRAGDAHARRRLTPRLRRFLERYFRLRR